MLFRYFILKIPLFTIKFGAGVKKIVQIVATDLQNGIGQNNALLCHLPKDLKYFKSMTTGKPIVMGHNTFKSIGRPLPKRENIVLSRRPQQSTISGVRFFENMDAALSYLHAEPEVMIIGGGALYRETQALATHLYQTLIHHTFNADTFYPEIKEEEWQLTSETFEPQDEKNPFDLSFKIFERKYIHPTS